MRHAARLSSLLAAAALAGCANTPLDKPMPGFGQAVKAAATEPCDPPHADAAPIASSGAHAAAVILRYMQRPRQAAGASDAMPKAGLDGGSTPSAAAAASSPSGI